MWAADHVQHRPIALYSIKLLPREIITIIIDGLVGVSLFIAGYRIWYISVYNMNIHYTRMGIFNSEKPEITRNKKVSINTSDQSWENLLTHLIATPLRYV